MLLNNILKKISLCWDMYILDTILPDTLSISAPWISVLPNHITAEVCCLHMLWEISYFPLLKFDEFYELVAFKCFVVGINRNHKGWPIHKFIQIFFLIFGNLIKAKRYRICLVNIQHVLKKITYKHSPLDVKSSVKSAWTIVSLQQHTMGSTPEWVWIRPRYVNDSLILI